MSENERIEALIGQLIETIEADTLGNEAPDIMCALANLTVRWALAVAKSDDDAKRMIGILLNDYFAQAQAMDAGGVQ